MGVCIQCQNGVDFYVEPPLGEVLSEYVRANGTRGGMMKVDHMHIRCDKVIAIYDESVEPSA